MGEGYKGGKMDMEEQGNEWGWDSWCEIPKESIKELF